MRVQSLVCANERTHLGDVRAHGLQMGTSVHAGGGLGLAQAWRRGIRSGQQPHLRPGGPGFNTAKRKRRREMKAKEEKKSDGSEALVIVGGSQCTSASLLFCAR